LPEAGWPGDIAAMREMKPRAALVLAGLAAALALAIAFAFEWYGGLVPCPLCLRERWPYRLAIALCLVGLLVPRQKARAVLALVLLAGVTEVALAGLHVGVEFRWWPSPLPECAAPHFSGGSIAAKLREMPARPSKSCEDAVYPVPRVPVSFAQGNLIYALAYSGLVVILLRRTKRRLT
jgi:disulfide bond formation protein DsbB